MSGIVIIFLLICCQILLCLLVIIILRRRRIRKFYRENNNCANAIIPGRWETHFKSPLCFCAKVVISQDFYDWAKRDLEIQKPNDEELCVWLNEKRLLKGVSRADFIVLPSLPENTIRVIV